jgi:hypothetical protein
MVVVVVVARVVVVDGVVVDEVVVAPVVEVGAAGSAEPQEAASRAAVESAASLRSMRTGPLWKPMARIAAEATAPPALGRCRRSCRGVAV